MLWLYLTRELYNAALQERRDAWTKQRKSISAYDQMHELIGVREVRPEFNHIPNVVQRGTIRRLDHAFAGFYRRCKNGESPGYPRYKGRNRWFSLLIDDLKQKIPIVAGGKRIAIPILGKVKFKMHRPMEGTPKAMRLKLERDGYWYVTFACVDVPAKPLSSTGKEIGIDLGLTKFITTSDGEMFENPRSAVQARLELERAQRCITRRKKGSKRRKRAVQQFARLSHHVVNIRREHHIKVAKDLVSRFDKIYVEALNIVGMARGMFAKSIHDVAWGNFLQWLYVKAESAGREVIEVDPRGTTQRCSGCDLVVEKSINDRIHNCTSCGLVLDRDINAAKNVLKLGRSLQGAALLVRGRQRSAKVKSTTVVVGV